MTDASVSAVDGPRVIQHHGSMRDLQAYIHDWAKRLGWWDQDIEKDRPIGSMIALMHSELSEALEEVRNGHDPNATRFEHRGVPCAYEEGEWRAYGETSGGAPAHVVVENPKPEGFGIELADCVIRILDTCERYGIDLQACIETKMAYNETRAWRHGGKLI